MTRWESFVVALAMLVISSNAKGQLFQATLGEGGSVRQSSTGVTPTTYGAGPYAIMRSASDFNGGTVTGPPGPYIPMTLVPEAGIPLILVPTVSPTGFSTPAALNAVFPFGTYQLTASNSVTLATELVNINYTQNYFPSAPPELTPASYAGLQNLSAGSAFDLQFNSFTPTPGATASFTDVEISGPSGALVFSSLGSLAPSTTDVVLPAERLAAGTRYNLTLAFVEQSIISESPTGTASGLPAVNTGIYEALDTFVTFTTAAGATPPQTLIGFIGGPSSSPVLLPPGPVGSVSSPIGGDGASDFYRFYWGGIGSFDAIASIAGANPSGSYDYELFNPDGTLNMDLVLDAADGFSATIDEALLEGLYEIGIVADSPFDPEFTIDFATPVEGVSAASVPEPATLPLLASSIFMLFLFIRREQRRYQYRF